MKRTCRSATLNLLSETMNLYLFIFTGSIVIYSIYEPNYDKTTAQPDLYCDKAFYLCAFWLTNVTYMLLALLFLSCCCCRQRQPDSDNETQTLVR